MGWNYIDKLKRDNAELRAGLALAERNCELLTVDRARTEKALKVREEGIKDAALQLAKTRTEIGEAVRTAPAVAAWHSQPLPGDILRLLEAATGNSSGQAESPGVATGTGSVAGVERNH